MSLDEEKKRKTDAVLTESLLAAINNQAHRASNYGYLTQL
jgi:hypothetical protein